MSGWGAGLELLSRPPERSKLHSRPEAYAPRAALLTVPRRERKALCCLSVSRGKTSGWPALLDSHALPVSRFSFLVAAFPSASWTRSRAPATVRWTAGPTGASATLDPAARPCSLPQGILFPSSPPPTAPHATGIRWLSLYFSESRGRFRPPYIAHSASNVLPAVLFPADVWHTPTPKIRHLLKFREGGN